MHFLDPNNICRKRGPSRLKLNLLSPVFFRFRNTSIETLYLAGCIMMNPIPAALQFVFKNIGKELLHLANTGDEVNTTLGESNRSISSGVQAMNGIFFPV